MARARTLKPGFFSNEALADCQPLARLLFEGLWLYADREGRLEDRPKRLKAEILPYDNCDADALLDELERARFIIRYEAEGIRCIQVLNFTKHQNPHPKEPASSLPAVESREKSRPEISRQEPVIETPERAGPFPISPFPIPDSSSDAYASAPDGAMVDPKSFVFGDLLGWLKSHTGRSEASIRSFLGKCCQQFGDEATAGAGMMVRAPPIPVEPLSAMRERLDRQAGRNGKKSTGPTPLTNLYRGAAEALAERERARNPGAGNDLAQPLLDSG